MVWVEYHVKKARRAAKKEVDRAKLLRKQEKQGTRQDAQYDSDDSYEADLVDDGQEEPDKRKRKAAAAVGGTDVCDANVVTHRRTRTMRTVHGAASAANTDMCTDRVRTDFLGFDDTVLLYMTVSFSAVAMKSNSTRAIVAFAPTRWWKSSFPNPTAINGSQGDSMKGYHDGIRTRYTGFECSELLHLYRESKSVDGDPPKWSLLHTAKNLRDTLVGSGVQVHMCGSTSAFC